MNVIPILMLKTQWHLKSHINVLLQPPPAVTTCQMGPAVFQFLVGGVFNSSAIIFNYSMHNYAMGSTSNFFHVNNQGQRRLLKKTGGPRTNERIAAKTRQPPQKQIRRAKAMVNPTYDTPPLQPPVHLHVWAKECLDVPSYTVHLPS